MARGRTAGRTGELLDARRAPGGGSGRLLRGAGVARAAQAGLRAGGARRGRGRRGVAFASVRVVGAAAVLLGARGDVGAQRVEVPRAAALVHALLHEVVQILQLREEPGALVVLVAVGLSGGEGRGGGGRRVGGRTGPALALAQLELEAARRDVLLEGGDAPITGR